MTGLYIGLREPPRRDKVVCTLCTDRPRETRAYTCLCGVRWILVADGWIKERR